MQPLRVNERARVTHNAGLALVIDNGANEKSSQRSPACAMASQHARPARKTKRSTSKCMFDQIALKSVFLRKQKMQ
jgi:hypothetical protein